MIIKFKIFENNEDCDLDHCLIDFLELNLVGTKFYIEVIDDYDATIINLNINLKKIIGGGRDYAIMMDFIDNFNVDTLNNELKNLLEEEPDKENKDFIILMDSLIEKYMKTDAYENWLMKQTANKYNL